MALRFSCQTREAAGDNYAAVQRALLGAIHRAAQNAELPSELMPPDPWPAASEGLLLLAALRAWAQRCPRPLVLFFDDVDALRGNGLQSVLRQLRDGYTSRPAPFPHSVALAGRHDLPADPFNVKVTSLRISDFTTDEVRQLYGRHTVETGQVFTDEAIERVFESTQGQPWLVNALARDVSERLVPSQAPVMAPHVDAAKERLISARTTHLDSLASTLGGPRVQRIIKPLIAGEFPAASPTYHDDVSYVRDLGLISPEPPLRVANPIYRAVIARALTTGPATKSLCSGLDH